MLREWERRGGEVPCGVWCLKEETGSRWRREKDQFLGETAWTWANGMFSQIVRRKAGKRHNGYLYVICKANPRHKQRQS